MSKNLLIVFSGLDSAGKSTQIDLMMEYLREAGQQPIYLWTRGGYTPAFNALKTLVRRFSLGWAVPPPGHNPQRTQAFSKTRLKRMWLWLALLDLMWVYGMQVRWWMWHGKAVVCDRYLWDTLVDFRLNFLQEAVERWWLWKLLVRITPRPDAAFLLLVPVEESVRRSDLKGEPFRDSRAVLTRRLAHYQALAQANHWQMLDGRCSIEDLAGQIQDIIKALDQPGLIATGIIMRISLLLQREPFGQILEKTLARFWEERYGQYFRITWHNGRPNRRKIYRQERQIWLCNIYLNAIFSPAANHSVFEPVRREFTRSVIAWRRPFQCAYVAMGTSRYGAPWLAQATLSVAPALPNASHKLIVAGNPQNTHIRPARRADVQHFKGWLSAPALCGRN